MNTKLICRIAAVLLLGVLYGIVLHVEMENRSKLGREAFLQQQAERWDEHYTHPHHLAAAVIACVGLSVVAFGMYEVIVACFYVVARKLSPPGEAIDKTLQPTATTSSDSTKP